MKRFFILFILPLIFSCSNYSYTEYDCPSIIISRNDARLYKNDGFVDKFQINMVGVESFCYTKAGKRFAEIVPIIKIRRLEQSSTNRVDFSFYVKTSKNAEDYLGKRVYQQSATISPLKNEETFKGKTTVTRIPMPPYNDFKIYLGFEMTLQEMNKSKQMLDIDYRYLSEEEIAEHNRQINTVYQEIEVPETRGCSSCKN